MSYGDEAKLVDHKIVVPKGVNGEGKRKDPFVFDATTKCFLTLPTSADTGLNKLEWDLEDGPPDAETMGDMGKIVVFSLTTPGLYQVSARWDGGWAKAWLEIKTSGPPPPPSPQSDIDKRIKAAFIGSTAVPDAVAFGKVATGMANALDAGDIKTTETFAAAWEAALKKVGWKAAYPDVTKLAGELFNGKGRDLSPEDIQDFSSKMKLLSVACASVK